MRRQACSSCRHAGHNRRTCTKGLPLPAPQPPLTTDERADILAVEHAIACGRVS